MCYSPTLIKNPNFGRKDSLAYLVDTVSQYIPVPCGHCGECRRLRSSGILQRAQLEALYGYPFMVSLSYNPESLSYYECSNGYQIPYAPISDLQNMFKRLRKHDAFGRRFRYFAVSELGSKKGRPHAHILLFLERLSDDTPFTPFNLEKVAWSAVLNEWRRNYATRVTKSGKVVADNVHPDYKPCLTFIRKFRYGRIHSTYDLHLVLPSSTGTTDDVSFYVTKYLCKDSKWVDKLKRNIYGHSETEEEALEAWSTVKPRAISSLNFGFGIYDDLNPRKISRVKRLEILSSLPSSDIVRKAVSLSDRHGETSPRFYDLETGKPMPFARYWYSFGHLLPCDVFSRFKERQDRLEGGVSVDDRSIDSKLISERTFERNSADSLTSNFDLLYAES